MLGLVRRGVLLGAGAGLVLSIVYTLATIPLFGVLLVVTNIPTGRVFEAFIGAWAFAICAWPFSIVLGILPAIMIGAVAGLIIAFALAFLRAFVAVSRGGAALVGLAVATLLVLSAHLTLGSSLIQSTRSGPTGLLPYFFWMVGPSLLLLCGLTWVGWRLGSEATFA